MTKYILTFMVFINSIYTLKSQECLSKQTFKVKDAKCIVEGQKVFMPFSFDVKTFKDSINLIIYQPENKIDLGIKITKVDTCNVEQATANYRGVFKATIAEVYEDSKSYTDSKVIFSRNKNIYTLQLILPQLNNSELILTMTEVIKRKAK